ncbi:MAG: LLM class flavin-dependent oxidoreductase [Alphaproteobacteria bacterium]
MAPKLGYLLPTRERIMEGRPEVASMLAAAEKAEDLGYDSIWVGDSVLARPRHEPISLLAGVAARTKHVELGTAVLLPALRNPVMLAHQVATVDQISEGRLILGVGIATDVPNIRAEFAAASVPFEKRVGTMLEGLRLCRALWTGEPVDWDGRWPVRQGVLAPTPSRPGGPPIWIGGSVEAAMKRAGGEFDGWFPSTPTAAGWEADFGKVQAFAKEAGRNPADVTGACYVTVTLDETEARAVERLDTFFEHYYNRPPEVMKKRSAIYAGSAAGAAEWLAGYADAGVEYFVLRFAGDGERQLEQFAKIRSDLGW